MKHQSFIRRSFSFLLILVVLGACSKDVVTTPPPPPPPPPPPQNTYTINDDNWTNTSPLKYQSDLYQFLYKYAGSNKSIISVTLMSYINGDVSTGLGDQELIPGNAIPLANGDLTFTGTALIYNEKIVNGQPPMLPFNSIILKVVVK